MSDLGPLVVPIAVDAWVLNEYTMQTYAPTDGSVRAQMTYQNLASWTDPSPPPFHADDGNFLNESANYGAYVMWTLPKALRHASEDESGTRSFPIVPNRWLVVRLWRDATADPDAAPSVTAWVVQSDALGDSSGVQYLDPTAARPSRTLLGKQVAVSDTSPWTEPAGQPPAFLRAVADGNPAFAAYQPFNQNVFSIHDPLDAGLTGTASYQVVGWYSDPRADVLASWQAGVEGNDFPDLMKRLGWVADTSTGTRSSVYQGLAAGVPWTPSAPHGTTPPAEPAMQVAVGNTTIDDVVAFAEAALDPPEPPPGWKPPPISADRARDLLEGFQYEMLTEVSSPDTHALIGDRLRRHWFSSRAAETKWTIVDAETPPGVAPPDPPTPGDLAAEDKWLADLNAAQATFDAKSRRLLSERRRLLELWWKAGFGSYYDSTRGHWPWGISPRYGAAELQSAVDAQAAVVAGLIQDMATAAAGLPTPTSGQTFAQAVQAFALAKGLPNTRVLKAVPGRPFASPVDPVMTVSGTQADMQLDPKQQLTCRWPSELVAGLTIGAGGGTTFTATAAEVAGGVGLTSAGLPAIVPTLCAELYLLDPANAGSTASMAGQKLGAAQVTAAETSVAEPAPTAGTVPSVLPPWPWDQPWRPVYLDWEVQWLPIPFDGWSFDGQDYETAPGAQASGSVPISGRALLTPKPSFEFRSTLEQFLTENPDSPVAQQLGELDPLLVNDWDLLSQAASGLTTQVARWSATTLANPDDVSVVSGGMTMAQLLGDFPESPPQSLKETYDPSALQSDFEGLRGGQLYLSRLGIVDAFGQYLDVMGSVQSFLPLRAEGVTPEHAVGSQNPKVAIELPPRLVQPARLNLDFVTTTGANPILAWILPNHLDQAIAVYGPDGQAYGELRPGQNPDKTPVVHWAPAAGSPYPDGPQQMASDHPGLSGFLTGLQSAGVKSLAAFIDVVDETLWTIDPLGARTDAFLSVMLGRPLALVSASASLELQADAYRDPSWPYTFAAQGEPLVEPAFLGYSFPVRLGDLGYRQDGLLGYFVDAKWSCFHAVNPDGQDDPYLSPVVPGSYFELQLAQTAGPGPAQPLTLLMDPRASVHATCGILPSITAALDPQWVDGALKAMKASFATGPALVGTDVPPHGARRILIPSPAERHGTWSWADAVPAKTKPTEMPLGPVDASPVFPDSLPTLREGTLNLSGGLD